ncbi:NOG1 family protein [Thermofilum pendens]|uniref:Small GTP-binding protein n=1 Tax=Thermofilum pendens (strain DSM 2475 / Hrk 5) TaxID=368408 RepID=A1RX70_THEPD|nr:GTPase [Thermofilum pendens]ABL77800.1 small GTP-binding protein [Thermofilum pendens Hrk 5]
MDIQYLKRRMVYAPQSVEELFELAVRSCKRKSSAKGVDKVETRRIRALECVKLAAGVLSSRLRDVALTSPFLEDLHPFYRSLVTIDLDVDLYKSCTSRLYSASKIIKKIGLEQRVRIRRAKTYEEIVSAEKAFFGRALSVLRELEECLPMLRKFQLTFAKLPEIDLDIPTVIIAGAPNVGKSSLLKSLTRAKPEVKPYPFTTKELIVGHIEHPLGKIQLVDTPGLLDRPLEEKNPIELKAVVALKHITGLVLFVVDPTETCGFTLDFQYAVYRGVKSFISSEAWIVVNKLDIAQTEHMDNFRRVFGAVDYVAVSAEKKIGVDNLKEKIIEKFAR